MVETVFDAVYLLSVIAIGITMTVFYVILYYVWRTRYQIQGKKGLTAAAYLLAAARIVLCLFPQNQWLSAEAPLSWGIYRNIPFALMGLLIIVLFYRSARRTADTNAEELAALMVGREITSVYEKSKKVDENTTDYAIELEHFAIEMPGERTKDVSLKVRKGEIFGIAGLADQGILKPTDPDSQFGLLMSAYKEKKEDKA